MNIAFIAAGNGFGHLRRVFLVVREIFKLNPAVKVIVLGASHHRQMLIHWSAFELFSEFQFEFVNAETENNLRASLDKSYTFDIYEQSLSNIQKKVNGHSPDLIVSDNLAGVLDAFPKALLTGSFLFSDTIAVQSPEIKKILDFEVELLATYKPVMLGVEDMAMPYVRQKTKFQGLPWFCERGDVKSDRHQNKKMHVLISGGGTRNALEILQQICLKIMSSEEITISVDQSLLGTMDNSRNLLKFNFDTESFQLLDWIICRPGVGILTDAVQYGIPVIAAYEEDKEMEYNATRIHDLNIGYNFGNNQRGDIFNILNQDTKVLVEGLKKRQTGGAAQAARFILNS